MANAGWRHKKREGYSPRIMKLARTAKKRRADIMTGPRILSVNGVRGVAWNGGCQRESATNTRTISNASGCREGSGDNENVPKCPGSRRRIIVIRCW